MFHQTGVSLLTTSHFKVYVTVSKILVRGEREAAENLTFITFLLRFENSINSSNVIINKRSLKPFSKSLPGRVSEIKENSVHIIINVSIGVICVKGMISNTKVGKDSIVHKSSQKNDKHTKNIGQQPGRTRW